MPLQLSNLPISTPYDPAADAAGSADPVGTLSGSERLAEILLPGLTARMWRARLLTFAVICADIAERVVRRRDDQEELRLPARLAFERMFVASLVRCEESDPGKYAGISRRIAGSRTARRALHANDEPLTKQNFIKGQVVNGPAGVVARLARALELLNEEGEVAGQGHDLRSCWARRATADEVTDADGEFYRRSLSAVLGQLEDDEWPSRNAPIWQLLADAFRPDRIPAAERQVIARFLQTEPQHGLRPRVLQLLLDERCAVVSRKRTETEGRGQSERRVLLNGIMPLLEFNPVDEHIGVAIRAIDAYEQFSEIFTAAFEVVVWGLLEGAASPAMLLQKPKALAILKQLQARLIEVVSMIRDVLPTTMHRVPFEDQRIPELMTTVLQDAERGAASVADLLDGVMARHERVQRDKRKPAWVDRSINWTLMPGTPIADDLWQNHPPAFIHPYRVLNAYSLMADLNLLKGGGSYGEEDGE